MFYSQITNIWVQLIVKKRPRYLLFLIYKRRIMHQDIKRNGSKASIPLRLTNRKFLLLSIIQRLSLIMLIGWTDVSHHWRLFSSSQSTHPQKNGISNNFNAFLIHYSSKEANQRKKMPFGMLVSNYVTWTWELRVEHWCRSEYPTRQSYNFRT